MQPVGMHHSPFQHPLGRPQGTLRVVLCLRRRLGLRVGPLPRRDRRSQGGVLKVVPGTKAFFLPSKTCELIFFLLFLQSEFKSVTFPQNGTVFDYYVDNQQQEFAPWIQLVPKFELDPDLPLQAVLVHTSGRNIYFQLLKLTR